MKPDIRIYQEVINTLNCNPSDIYFFDDREDNVEAAKKCGINAFQVTGYTIEEKFNNLK